MTLDVSKFAYGPAQATEFVTSLPTTPMNRALDPAVGGYLDGDSGMRATYVVYQLEVLAFALRYFETEWPSIVAMINEVMDGQQFKFFPLASDATTFFWVTLESPAPGTAYFGVPDGQYPRALALAIELSAVTDFDALVPLPLPILPEEPDGGGGVVEDFLPIRTSTGLLFHDEFTRADAATLGPDYAVSGSITAVAIDTNRAKINCTNGSGYIRVNPLGNRKDVHTQVKVSRNNLQNYVTIMHRCTAGVPPNDLYQFDIGGSTDGVDPNKTRLYRRTAAAYTRLAGGLAPAGLAVNVIYRLTFSSLGTDEHGWVNGVSDGVVVDATAGNQVPGAVQIDCGEVGGPGIVFLDDIAICSSRTVTMTGVPAGYKLRVAGIVSTASDGDGAISVDLLGTALPVAIVEVLTAADVVDRSLSPADGVWGGDTFAYGTFNAGLLKRFSSGLIFRDNFNRPNEQLVGATKNWEKFGASTADSDWNIVGNMVVMNAAGAPQSDIAAKHPGYGDDLVVQAKWSRGAGGRSGIGFVTPGQAANLDFLRDPSNGWELWEHPTGGAFTLRATNLGNVTDAATLKFRRRKTTGRHQAWRDEVQIFDIAASSSITSEPLRGALVHDNNAVTYDDAVICKGNVITCIGLPTGWKIRCGTLVAVEASGTASLDMQGLTFPQVKVEVLNAGNELIAEFVPADGVWGGDAYAYDATPLELTPVAVGLGPAGVYDGVAVGFAPYHVGTTWYGESMLNSKPNLTSPPGRMDTSQSLPITITFGSSVGSVTITAYDAGNGTDDENWLIAYNAADVEIGRTHIPFNGLTHKSTVSVIVPGIRKVVLSPALGDWVAYLDLSFGH